nr:MAG TPA: hypothetical protein [Bacteriophage sp.]
MFSYFCPHSANEPLLIHYDKLNQNCRKFSGLDIQSVRKCKLQGVVCVFLKKNRSYRVCF